MHCWKCGSEAFVKNGFMAGAQRYKCKKCGFQFTRDTPHGKALKDKILALVLYGSSTFTMELLHPPSPCRARGVAS